MILSFNIEYRTNWGEEVRIAGLSPESVPLHTTDGIYWTAELEFEVPNEGLTIHYNYQIEQNGIVTRKEWDSFSRCLFQLFYCGADFRVFVETGNDWPLDFYG